MNKCGEATENFLSRSGVIIDVRSPGEFAKGHIPQSFNMPLFTDAERAVIGTLYKQTGQQAAILMGLKLVEPKLAAFAQAALEITHQKTAKVLCWRGGMRSHSMAWLFQTVGIQTITLKNGYKAYRHFVRSQLERTFNLRVLVGLTGSGKTLILQELSRSGEQVLDLEALANHRGSSFGLLGKDSQPSQEQFENDLADKLHLFDLTKPLWIENESRMIGTVKIPDPLFHNLCKCPAFEIQRPIQERLEHLIAEYGSFSKESLIEATKRLLKRLGGLRTTAACQLIIDGNLKKAASIILEYYDKTYTDGIKARKNPVKIVKGQNLEASQWAALLKETADKTFFIDMPKEPLNPLPRTFYGS